MKWTLLLLSITPFLYADTHEFKLYAQELIAAQVEPNVYISTTLSYVADTLHNQPLQYHPAKTNNLYTTITTLIKTPDITNESRLLAHVMCAHILTCSRSHFSIFEKPELEEAYKKLTQAKALALKTQASQKMQTLTQIMKQRAQHDLKIIEHTLCRIYFDAIEQTISLEPGIDASPSEYLDDFYDGMY